MVLTVLAAVFASNLTNDAVSVRSLVTELGNASQLAEFPKLSYRLLHTSSYDRSQKDPKDAKGWFGNNDYGQFIRTEEHEGRTEWVVMDQSGPGAITHVWTPLLAEKDRMLVRIYLDGSQKPAIEVPFNDWMRGKGMFKPPFAFTSYLEKGVESGVGSDLYFPIPYQNGCKVTFSEIPFYYSFDYRAYPSQTSVRTWSPAEVAESNDIMLRVGHQIEKQPQDAQDVSATKSVVLAVGAKYTMTLRNGQRAIDLIRVSPKATLTPQELRSIVISVAFDGEETVWMPIGEFFGAGVRQKPVWDRFRSVNKSGAMSARWTMPYRKSGKVSLTNLSNQRVSLGLEVRSSARKWDEGSMHFHATWRNQASLPTRRFSDWNYLEARGQGVYVGDTLTVFSPASGWYGEGDERIYVDGETFPSHLGTGTEDYYGYAWGMAGEFSSAFLSMPERDLKGRENWRGFTTTSRVRGLDAIPFSKSLKFDMEIWDWADCNVAYSASCFWYGKPFATSNRSPLPKEAAATLPKLDGDIVGAIEFENLEIAEKSDGVSVSTQAAGLSRGSWSGGFQAFIQAAKPGDYVVWVVPAQRAQTARLILYATKSFDYGIVRFTLPGGVVKDVDLWSDTPVASGPLDLGVFRLPSGQFAVRAEIVGANPKARGSKAFFGLDCMVLKPQIKK